jgi:hypothetical protein
MTKQTTFFSFDEAERELNDDIRSVKVNCLCLNANDRLENFLEKLKKYRNVTRLTITHFTTKRRTDYTAILDHLKHNDSLERLSLSLDLYFDVYYPFYETFLKALAGNTNLIDLTLVAYDFLGDADALSDDDFAALLFFLSHNITVKRLIIGAQPFLYVSDAIVYGKHIRRAVKKNPVIEFMNFHGTTSKKARLSARIWNHVKSLVDK